MLTSTRPNRPAPMPAMAYVPPATRSGKLIHHSHSHSPCRAPITTTKPSHSDRHILRPRWRSLQLVGSDVDVR